MPRLAALLSRPPKITLSDPLFAGPTLIVQFCAKLPIANASRLNRECLIWGGFQTILPLGGGGPCEAWWRGTRAVSCPIHVARLRPCPPTTFGGSPPRAGEARHLYAVSGHSNQNGRNRNGRPKEAAPRRRPGARAQPHDAGAPPPPAPPP